MDNSQVLQALKIKVEADVQGAITNLKALDVALGGIVKNVNQVTALATALNRLNGNFAPSITPPDTSKAEQKTETLRRKLETLTQQRLARIELQGDVSIKDIKESIKFLESQKIQLSADIDVSKINQKLAILRQELNRKNNIVINTDSAAQGLENVNRQATQTVRNFEQIIRDTPSFAISAQQGFIAISNNIGPLQDSFARLAAEAKASGQSVGKALLSQLGGWNAVGIAISIAVTAFTFFLAKSKEANTKAKELKDTIDGLVESANNVKPVSIGGVQGDVEKINALRNIITDSTSSIELQNRAKKELIKTDKDFFGGLEKSKNLIADVTKLTNEYTDAIIKQAVATGYQNEISKLDPQRGILRAENAELEKKKKLLLETNPNVADDVLNSNTRLDGLSAAGLRQRAADLSKVGKVQESLKLLNFIEVKEEWDKFDIKIKQNNASINTLSGSLSKLKTGLDIALKDSLSAADIGKDGQDSVSNVDNILKNRLSKQKSALEAELETLKEYNKNWIESFSVGEKEAAINKELDLVNQINNLDLQIKLIDTKDDPLSKGFVLQEAKAIGEKVQQEFDSKKITLKIQLIEFKEEDTKAFFEKIQRQLEDQEKNFAPKKIELPATISINGTENILKDANLVGIVDQIQSIQKILYPNQEPTDLSLFAGMEEGTKTATELLESLRKSLDTVQQSYEQIAELISNNIANAFATVFDELISKGTLSLNTIKKALGQLLLELGTLIAKAIIFKSIMSALTGGADGGSSSGVSKFLVELAKLLSPKKMATGGIVTRPTYSLIGEGNQPEAVLPLSYLNNLLDTSAGAGMLTAKVSGDDLLFIMNRTNRRQNRSF